MIRALAVAAAITLALPADALACSCLAPTVESSYNSAEHTIVGQVLRRTVFPGWHVYDVRVIRDLRDSNARGEIVQIVTADNQAACGDSFNVNQRYVLFADDTRVAGATRWSTTYCRGNRLVSTLTSDQEDFLRSREMIAPSGQLTCADPAIPLVTCLVDPCSGVTPCPGATCESNFCGGCNAELYDRFGYAACVP